MHLELNKFKNVLWDFDGVILDSMEVRDIGFVEIFKGFDSKMVDELLDFHRTNGGWSRYVKIEHFLKNIAKVEYDQNKVVEYAERFSKIMKIELVKKKYLIQDSVEFIRQNHSKTNYHIVSGSDHKELNYLCKELGIADCFLSIQGSPTPKIKLVKDLLSANNYLIYETCLIGDSINDLEAAQSNSIAFFGYNNPSLNEGGNYIHAFTS